MRLPTQQFLNFDTPIITTATVRKIKLPAPRHVNRTRLAMLAAVATFGRLSVDEQAEFDAAMGNTEAEAGK